MSSAIFSFFERLIDPYQRYDDSRPPPTTLLRFYGYFLHPVRWLVFASLGLGLVIAVTEALLIALCGRPG